MSEAPRILKASFAYFLSVFAVGFALGPIRVSFLVPRLGERLAELMELPLMLVASFVLARRVVRWFGPFSTARRLSIGALSLVFLAIAELGTVLIVLEQSFAHYVASRDPVSGMAYVLSLVAFALMPLLAVRGQGYST